MRKVKERLDPEYLTQYFYKADNNDDKKIVFIRIEKIKC